MKSTYLGIDLGTSAIKIVLIDDRKNVIGQSSREYEISHPFAGWSEIDPQIWFDSMMAGLKEVLEGQDPGKIKTIGITGQMHTLILLDEEGAPVCPAIMWNDKRTKEFIPELKEKLRAFPEGDYLSGIISTGSPAANLYWMGRKEPEKLQRSRHFLIGPDYLVYRLTGQISTDYCEASTSSLYQIRERKWSDEVRELLGISADIYPRIHGSAQPVGAVLPGISGLLGISPDVQVIAGTGDNPAAAISTGCLGQGYPVLSLGTSGVLMVPVNTLEAVAKGKVILYSSDADIFSYLIQGVVQSNGESVNWWARKILGLQEYGKLTRDLDLENAAASSLLFYPHLSGDKTIYADSELRGSFIGLSTETTAEEMFYAVMEGLCFAFRQLAEQMRLPVASYGSLKVVGGGSKNEVWMQTLANVLEVKIEKMEGMIGPAFGIALLASGMRDGRVSMEAITRDCLRVEKVYEPDPEAVIFYEEKYRQYLRIHDAMKYIDDGSLLSPVK